MAFLRGLEIEGEALEVFLAAFLEGVVEIPQLSTKAVAFLITSAEWRSSLSPSGLVERFTELLRTVFFAVFLEDFFAVFLVVFFLEDFLAVFLEEPALAARSPSERRCSSLACFANSAVVSFDAAIARLSLLSENDEAAVISC